MTEKRVKVTTTNNMDGVSIDEYIGPITSHVVLGMNIFKDMFSGLTDIFGGKSRSYEKTLSSINESVINGIKKKAYALGANCVLGLTIDNDEISAQGKSMIMVTAMGTAAKATFKEQLKVTEGEYNYNQVNLDTLNILRKKKDLIETSNQGEMNFDEGFWDFVKQHRVHELAKPIMVKYFDILDRFKHYDSADIKAMENHLREYFSIIDEEMAYSTLYWALHQTEPGERLSHILEIIRETHLIDFRKVNELIQSGDIDLQKRALPLISYDKLAYERKDVDSLKMLVDTISTKIPAKGYKEVKKKGLSGKEKEIWKCECGKENDIESKYCSKCNIDIYGFEAKYLGPVKARSILDEKIAILNDVLS